MFVKRALLTFGLLSLLSACAPGGDHKPLPSASGSGRGGSAGGAGGSAGAGGGGAGAEIVGYDQVKPVFARVCAACHPGKGPHNWQDYAEAKANLRSIHTRVIVQKNMPPPNDPSAPKISEQDRALIARWIEAGGPQVTTQAAAPAPSASGGDRSSGTPAAGGTAGGSATEPGDTANAGPQVPAVVAQCVSCHQAPSASAPTATGEIPQIAGQNEEYLVVQLRNFSWWDRIDQVNAGRTMNKMMANPSVTPEQMTQMAKYFATQKGLALGEPPKVSASERALFERGRELAGTRPEEGYCYACHGARGPDRKTSAPEAPVLNGQSELYTRNQLLYFRTRQRLHPEMNEYVKNLTNDDIAALAFYYARIR